MVSYSPICDFCSVNPFFCSSIPLSNTRILLCVQVEETTREREERLKGWESFLGEEKQSKDASAGAPKSTGTDAAPTSTQPAAPPAESNGQGTAAGTADPTAEGTSGGEQSQGEEEEGQDMGAESTDSSVAGSDEEDEGDDA